MPHRVDIVRSAARGLTDREVRAGVVAVLTALKIRRAQAVSVAFVADAAMRVLNRRTRKIDKTTDVLSFPGGVVPFPGDLPQFGDVVVNVPYARRDAVRLGITLRHELFDLLVHGLLHCGGYDHKKSRDASRMFSLQERLVDRLCSRS